jgi:hypothetical protein
VREIAQLSAVLGHVFAYEMISGFSTIGEATLRKGLGQLVTYWQRAGTKATQRSANLKS